jgi:hypothetical protein
MVKRCRQVGERGHGNERRALSAQFSGTDTGARLGQALTLLARLVGLIVIASVFSTVRSTFGSDSLAAAVNFCSTCIIFAAILDVQYTQLYRPSEFFRPSGRADARALPVHGGVYAMGGNVTTAAASGGTLYVLLSVLEAFCAGTIVPVGSMCGALALCVAVSPK